MPAPKLFRPAAALALAFLSAGLFAKPHPPTPPATSTMPATGRGRGGGMMQPGTLPAVAPGKDPFWGTWNTTDPKVVGTRVALNLLGRRLMAYNGGPNDGIIYPESCTGFGSLRFAQSIGDKTSPTKSSPATPSSSPRKAKPTSRPPTTSITACSASSPLKSPATSRPSPTPTPNSSNPTSTSARTCADLQWANPQGRDATADETALMNAGLTYQTRFWVDDMFMITGLQVQAFRATGDKVYLDRAATKWSPISTNSRNPTASSSTPPIPPSTGAAATAGSPSASPNCCSNSPPTTPNYARVLEGYRK